MCFVFLTLYRNYKTTKINTLQFHFYIILCLNLWANLIYRIFFLIAFFCTNFLFVFLISFILFFFHSTREIKPNQNDIGRKVKVKTSIPRQSNIPTNNNATLNKRDSSSSSSSSNYLDTSSNLNSWIHLENSMCLLYKLFCNQQQ